MSDEHSTEEGRHVCAYPAAGCTAPDCHVTESRGVERAAEALMRVDHDHRVTCTGPGEVGCLAYPGWHSWRDHRRHVAEAQVAELERIGLLRLPRFRPAAPSEGGEMVNTLTIGATPEKYPLNKALSMDPSHVHLWTTGEEPDTFRCAECNTVGRLVMDSPRFRAAAPSQGSES